MTARRFTDDLPKSSDDDPSAELLGQIAAALHRILASRGLWNSSPAVLDYPEFPNWNDPDALARLATDGYIDAVLLRWNGLQDSRDEGIDINPLIYRNLQLFVGQRHRRGDPPGAAVYANVLLAVAGALKRGICRRRGHGDAAAPVRKVDEILFEGYPDAEAADRSTVGRALELSCNPGSLAVDLIVRNAPAQRRLTGILAELPVHGLLCFVVGTLVSVLQNVVKRGDVGRHLSRDDEGETVDLLLPGVELATGDLAWREFREGLGKLRERVIASNHRDSAKDVMLRVLAVYVRAVENKEDPPTVAQVARLLGKPSVTVWEARARLSALREGLF